MKATLYFDGGARPRNPGYSACAYVLFPDSRPPVEFSRYLGIGTNNQAEYLGLCLGLKRAQQEGVRDLHIFTDSRLIEGHMAKQWTIGPELFAIARTASELLTCFEHWEIAWTRRDGNKQADWLCGAAINWGRNRNPWTARIKGELQPAFIKDPYAKV